ncbi:MAG TPA: hypothetical protein VMV23_01560 [Candidatus Nanopelagicaceae bacterium]|nr:hypothetical protein [Candidatus Nanopelagicaceae bacterium]
MLAEPVTVAVTLIEAPGRGWVAHASELRAVAQGVTQEEALANLRDLVQTYPEALDELRSDASWHLELVTL